MDNGYVSYNTSGIADPIKKQKSLLPTLLINLSLLIYLEKIIITMNVTLDNEAIIYPIRTVYGPIYQWKEILQGVLLDLKDPDNKIYNNNTFNQAADLNEYLGYADDTRTFVSSEKK